MIAGVEINFLEPSSRLFVGKHPSRNVEGVPIRRMLNLRLNA